MFHRENLEKIVKHRTNEAIKKEKERKSKRISNMRNLSEEEKSRIYKEIGVDESKLHPLGDANICVQLFGHEDEDGYDEYNVLNFMPRKERCCDIELNITSKEDKNELEEILEDSIERMKIAAYLMGNQLEELRNEGKIKTTFYYWEL